MRINLLVLCFLLLCLPPDAVETVVEALEADSKAIMACNFMAFAFPKNN